MFSSVPIRNTWSILPHAGFTADDTDFTSNCIYTGMPLRRYELMLDIWRTEGNYAPGGL
jgi:hypothetical protein